MWFTVVHVNPIEFPGLFAFAIVLGLCFMRTGRRDVGVGTCCLQFHSLVARYNPMNSVPVK